MFHKIIMSDFETLPRQIVHIRIQQRSGKKALTTVQGLNEKINFELLLKAFKSEFGCNGNIIEDEEHGKIIQLQGDKRRLVYDFLVNEKISEQKDIVVHGF